MLRIAFASTDHLHVDMHFGAADRLAIYEVAPGVAELLGVGEFDHSIMKGENKDKKLPAGTVYTPGPEMEAKPGELDRPPEDKVLAKLAFLEGCAAVYAASIGTSSIKRLMAMGVQPIIVGNGQAIEDLLNEISLALCVGGLSWVDKAKARAEAALAAGKAAAPAVAVGEARERRELITSIDELD